jgi:hypothetical protein
MTESKSYFSDAEWACKCSCGEQPQQAIKKLANKVRHEWGKPLCITSGKRCAAHNKKIGGAAKSAHVAGLAVDFRPFDMDALEEFQNFCIKNLDKWDCRMEHPAHATGWVHLDLYPVGPSGRLFTLG